MVIKSHDPQVTWPITVNCPATGFDLVVSMPADMERTPCDSDPTGFKIHVNCPLCTQKHDLKSDQIPPAIFQRIPGGGSMGIMQYHD